MPRSDVFCVIRKFAWGAGALMAPLTGMLSDRIGFFNALLAVSVLPMASAALLWRYPKDENVARMRVHEAMAVGD